MGTDTAPLVPEVVEGAAGFDLAGALGPLASFLPAGALDALGALMPDPDATTVDDLDESLSELHGKVDRALVVLDAIVTDLGAIAEAFSGPLAKAGIRLATRNLSTPVDL